MPKSNYLLHIERHKEIFDVIHAIYRIANSAFTAKDLLSGLLRTMQNSFNANHCSIVLSYPNRHPFIKFTLKNKRKYQLKKGGKSLLTKKEKEIFNSGRIYFTKKTIVVPLIFINTLGVVTIKRGASIHPFEENDKQFLNILAEEMALVVRNFQLYEEQHRTIIGTVKAITGFVNRYAPTSSIHAEYIHKILKELGKRFRLTESQLISLEYATLLHDTGKIEIPQDLLEKSDPLTKEEKEIIKKHPKKGAEILKNLQALRPAIPIILYHHEKYDGTGYPSGLRKKQIPLEARIMSVIDAFDAMVFGRPYKKSLNLEDAIKELEKNKGTQFDPEIVDAFVKTLHSKEVKKYLKNKLKKV
ncbi:MAG: HD domain-containing protein [Candidatus Omnitrophica bacterium]|nr:HD domain-containing protein [Candidatus Omnitrophota bacterium]